MKRVTGIGGVFFKASDPGALYAWYEKHLGIKREADGFGAIFHWNVLAEAGTSAEEPGMTIWSIFPEKTANFGTGPQTFMMNYRVDDMDALLTALESEGVTIDPKRDNHEFGKFAWIVDPEGNRIELWEAPKQGS